MGLFIVVPMVSLLWRFQGINSSVDEWHWKLVLFQRVFQ